MQFYKFQKKKDKMPYLNNDYD